MKIKTKKITYLKIVLLAFAILLGNFYISADKVNAGISCFSNHDTVKEGETATVGIEGTDINPEDRIIWNVEPSNVNYPDGKRGDSIRIIFNKEGSYTVSFVNLDDSSKSGSCNIIVEYVASVSSDPSNKSTTGKGTSKTISPKATGIEITSPIDAKNLEDVINLITDIMLQVAIPIVVLLILWSGVMFMTSQGNSEKITKAKDVLSYALLGFAIVLIGKGFVSVIMSILNLRK